MRREESSLSKTESSVHHADPSSQDRMLLATEEHHHPPSLMVAAAVRMPLSIPSPSNVSRQSSAEGGLRADVITVAQVMAATTARGVGGALEGESVHQGTAIPSERWHQHTRGVVDVVSRKVHVADAGQGVVGLFGGGDGGGNEDERDAAVATEWDDRPAVSGVTASGTTINNPDREGATVLAGMMLPSASHEEQSCPALLVSRRRTGKPNTLKGRRYHRAVRRHLRCSSRIAAVS